MCCAYAVAALVVYYWVLSFLWSSPLKNVEDLSDTSQSHTKKEGNLMSHCIPHMTSCTALVVHRSLTLVFSFPIPILHAVLIIIAILMCGGFEVLMLSLNPYSLI